MISKRRVCVLAVMAVGLAIAAPALGSTITFTGHEGDRWAEAVFTLDGSTLTVQLSNISTVDALVPVDVLTGLFFSTGTYSLTAESAYLTDGSAVIHAPATDAFGVAISGGTYSGGDVGAEWAYCEGLDGAPGDASQGISSVGLNLFGPGDRFDAATDRDLQKPASPDGLQYGLTSLGDDADTGNVDLTGKYALIQNSVLFTFTAANGFSLADISDVSFQYGTDLSEPNIPPLVPEPASVLLLGMGIGGLLLHRFQRPRE